MSKVKMPVTKIPKNGDVVIRGGVRGKVVSIHHKSGGYLIEWIDGKHESVSSSALNYIGNGRFEL